MYFLPRYFSMVFAFAGDSTTTSVFFGAVLRFAFAFFPFADAAAPAVFFAALAAKVSLPLRTQIAVRFVFNHQPLELQTE